MILPTNSGHGLNDQTSIPPKKQRKKHTPEFRSEALKLAERIGVAASDLNNVKMQTSLRAVSTLRGYLPAVPTGTVALSDKAEHEQEWQLLG